MRRVLEKIGRKLRKPIFGTQAVPRDPHLDLSQLPEHAFPVYCMKCDYCLRGIPDGRCPECGGGFTRETLLVEQYVKGLGSWRAKQSPLSRSRNWVTVLLLLGYPLSLAGFLFWITNQSKNPATVKANAIRTAITGWKLVWVFLGICAIGVFIWSIIHTVKRQSKRKRVVDAICDDAIDDSDGATAQSTERPNH